MKLEDLNELKYRISRLREITSRVNYNVSTTSNIELLSMEKIVDNEQKRLESTELSIQCPQYLLITKSYNEKETEKQVEQELVKLLNNKLLELTANNYIIIDYGINYINNKLEAYIKYKS